MPGLARDIFANPDDYLAAKDTSWTPDPLVNPIPNLAPGKYYVHVAVYSGCDSNSDVSVWDCSGDVTWSDAVPFTIPGKLKSTDPLRAVWFGGRRVHATFLLPAGTVATKLVLTDPLIHFTVSYPIGNVGVSHWTSPKGDLGSDILFPGERYGIHRPTGRARAVFTSQAGRRSSRCRRAEGHAARTPSSG